MKQKPLLYISAGINLALVIIVIASLPKAGENNGSERKWSPSQSSEDPSVALATVNETGEISSETLEQIPTFRWSQIESEDYAKYIKNLRSVGCPETTIRDIVEADINDLYEPQYLGLLQQSQAYDSWRNGPNHLPHQEALRSQIIALDDERLGHLRSLLGDGYTPGEKLASISHQDLIARSSIGFLSPELQDSVSLIMDEFEAREREIRLEFSESRDRGQLNLGLAENKQSRRDALSEVLDDEELFELDLRDSHAAASLRNKLRGFDVSESEFRDLFAQRQAYETAQGEVPDYSNPEKIAERTLARQELEASYRDTLGKNRYTDLQRQGDSDWQSLLKLEESTGLSRDLMTSAYDLRREASRALMLEMGSSELSEAERETLTVAAKAQYQREMTALIGGDGFDAVGELRQRTPIRFTTSSNDGQSSIMMLGDTAADGFGLAEEIVRGFMPDGGQFQSAETRILTLDQPSAITIQASPILIPSPTP